MISCYSTYEDFSQLAAFTGAVMNNIADLAKKQEKNFQDVAECKSILRSLAAHCLPSRGEFSLASSMPFSSIEQVLEIEGWLQDDSNLESMVAYLSLFRGSSVPDSCRKMLRVIMTKELACKYNWAGRGEKQCFSNLKLKQCIISAILKHESGAAIPVIEESVKNWLKNSIIRCDKHKL